MASLDPSTYCGAPSAEKMIFGSECQYPPAVCPSDLVLADFRIREVVDPGLYLFEVLKDGAVEWRGCARLHPRFSGMFIDQLGNGDWTEVDLAAIGIRIVAAVREVYKPSLNTRR